MPLWPRATQISRWRAVFSLRTAPNGLSSKTRHQISNTGIRLANFLFGLKLTDPLTGFFVIRRNVVLDALPELSEIGFKVLLDFITAAKPAPKVVELPFKFRERLHGESKLDNRVMYDFFLFFAEKKIAPIIPLPARFLSFALINAFGILIHLAALSFALSAFGVGFENGALVATFLAMSFNYWANNTLTYRDRRLKGVKFYIGFLVFAGLSSVGVIANVGVASMLHEQYRQPLLPHPGRSRRAAHGRVELRGDPRLRLGPGPRQGTQRRAPQNAPSKGNRNLTSQAGRRGRLRNLGQQEQHMSQSTVASQNALQRILQHQALKYLIIGGAASAIDVVLFMALYNLASFTDWQSHSDVGA